MCCWHQLPRVLSRRGAFTMCVVDINFRVCCLAAGRSRGRSPSDRPAARQHTRELMSTTHTYPWLIPIITWCRLFPFVPTNILLIKSKSKFESRAIAVGVAMSPRNLGGKYRCRPHPRGAANVHATVFFLREPERVNRTAPEWRHRLTIVTTSSNMWYV